MFSPMVLPVTVMQDRSSLLAQIVHQRAQAAGVEEILHQVFARRPHIGEHRHLRATAGRSVSMSIGMPARRAIATTWMMALVEPPIAMCTLMALSNAAAVRIFSGVRSSHTMSTMRRPATPHMRGWLASAAGIDDAPGSDRPERLGDRHHGRGRAHHHAGAERAGDAALDLVPFLVGDVAGALLGPVFPDVRAGAEVLAVPVAAQHRAGRNVDRRDAHADRAHDQAGRGLVAAAHQHRAVDRMAAQQLLGLHRQHVAIEHGRRLDEGLRQRHRRQFDREAAGLQHAALDVLGARAQMRVAGIDLAPGVDDADDRLAVPILGVVADLAQPRAVAERAHVADAEPAMAAQIFGTFLAGIASLTLLRMLYVSARAARLLDREIGGVHHLLPISRFRRRSSCRNRPAEPGHRGAAEVLRAWRSCSGSLSAALISLLSMSTISFGVPCRRAHAEQGARLVAWHGLADGRHVGQFAASAASVVTASARSLPALMWPIDDGMLSKVTCTWPPSRSVSAGAEPLIRHVRHLHAGHHLEQLAGQMDRGAVAGRRHVDLAGIGLGVGDELGDGLRRHVGIDLHHVRHADDAADRRRCRAGN